MKFLLLFKNLPVFKKYFKYYHLDSTSWTSNPANIKSREFSKKSSMISEQITLQ